MGKNDDDLVKQSLSSMFNTMYDPNLKQYFAPPPPPPFQGKLSTMIESKLSQVAALLMETAAADTRMIDYAETLRSLLESLELAQMMEDR